MDTANTCWKHVRTELGYVRIQDLMGRWKIPVSIIRSWVSMTVKNIPVMLPRLLLMHAATIHGLLLVRGCRVEELGLKKMVVL